MKVKRVVIGELGNMLDFLSARHDRISRQSDLGNDVNRQQQRAWTRRPAPAVGMALGARGRRQPELIVGLERAGPAFD